jgi:preprotein translocase SecE subunit
MNWKNILAELRQYPQGVIEEARKVDWPTKEQTLRLSAVSGVVIAIATLYVAGLDLVFSRLIQFILTK